VNSQAPGCTRHGSLQQQLLLLLLLQTRAGSKQVVQYPKWLRPAPV
jgi:hypothetical protein